MRSIKRRLNRANLIKGQKKQDDNLQVLLNVSLGGYGRHAQARYPMKLPALRGTIDRRILANYRIDPNVVKEILPEPFRPKIISGFAVGGICLIRLKSIRPRFVLLGLGIGSENAAHRFAVERTENGKVFEGVYIPRRDTSSLVNTLVGGRIFPGVHHHATFAVEETSESISIVLVSDDRQTHVSICGTVTDARPCDSVLSSFDVASDFCRRGSLGVLCDSGCKNTRWCGTSLS